MSSDSDSYSTEESYSGSSSYDSGSCSLVSRFLPSADDKPKDVSEQRIFKTPREKALSEGAKISKGLEPLLERKEWVKVPEQLTLLQNWYEKSKRFFHHYPEQYLFALNILQEEVKKIEENNELYTLLKKADAKGFNSAKMFLKKLDAEVHTAMADYDEHPSKYDDNKESSYSSVSGSEGSESEDEIEIREDGLDLMRIFSFFGLKRETKAERERRELEEEKERVMKELKKDTRLPILNDEDLVRKLNKLIEAGSTGVISDIDLQKKYDSLMNQTIEKHLQLLIASEQMNILLSPMIYITRLVSTESTERLFSLFDAVLRMLIEDAKANKYNETIIKAANVNVNGKEVQPHTFLNKLVSNLLTLSESVERALQTDNVRTKEFQINLSHISNMFSILRVMSVLMIKTLENKQEGSLFVQKPNQINKKENDMKQVVGSFIVKLNHACQSICYSLTGKQFDTLVSNCFMIQGRFSLEFPKEYKEETIKQLNEEALVSTKGPRSPIVKEVKAKFVKVSEEKLKPLDELYPEAKVTDSLEIFSKKCFEDILKNTPSDPKALNNPSFSETELARDRVRSLLMYITTMCNNNILSEGLTLFQNSCVSSTITHSDPRTQILYNRAILAIGLCAFKKGNFQLSKDTLSELTVHFLKPKQLLGQRYIEQNQTNQLYQRQKTELESWLIRRALIPQHLHIQTDLIEIVSFLSCAILDAPTLAKCIASGTPIQTGSKQVQIGRVLSSIYSYMNKTELVYGVDSPKGIMGCYCRSVLKGDWKQAVVSLEKLMPVIYKGLNGDVDIGKEEKGEKVEGQDRPFFNMLREKTKYVSLECYLVMCNYTISSMDIATLAESFEISQSVLVDYLNNKPSHRNYTISDDYERITFNDPRQNLNDSISQVMKALGSRMNDNHRRENRE